MNKTVFAVLMILFNQIGVPYFIQGDTKKGILRIVFGVVSCSVLFVINFVFGVIEGIKILQMTDEEYEAKKGTFNAGICPK